MSGRPAPTHPAARPTRTCGAAALFLALALALALPGAGLAWLVGPAVPLAAAVTCPSPVALDQAIFTGGIVFVGTVTATSNKGRWAAVRVEERWRGADALPAAVDVEGGPGPGDATPFDRTYEMTRYLFIVLASPTGSYLDSVCTGTRPWSRDLARYRPLSVTPQADVVADTPVSPIPADLPIPLVALIGSLIIAVLAYLIVLRARRRPPDWFR
jgi:hypothetical protein